MTVKPTPAQFRFILAILERGGADVSGNKLFHYRTGITCATTTLRSCQRRGWVKREERPDGVAYWSVTLDGRADAECVDPGAVDRALARGRLRLEPRLGR